jgi:hypothetical protein
MMTDYAQQMAALMQSMQQPQVVVANQPKRKVARTARVNGEYVTTIEEIPQESVQ